jgi:hypothetical protein
MKLSNLIDPRFKSALTKLNQQQLPLRVAFKLKGTIGRIDEEQKKYEDVRLAALNKYGKKNEDGTLSSDSNGNVALEGADAELFVKDLNDLLSLDIELPSFSVNELGDKVTMSSEELFLLDFISE